MPAAIAADIPEVGLAVTRLGNDLVSLSCGTTVSTIFPRPPTVYGILNGIPKASWLFIICIVIVRRVFVFIQRFQAVDQVILTVCEDLMQRSRQKPSE